MEIRGRTKEMTEPMHDPPTWKLILAGMGFVALFVGMAILRIKEGRKK